MAVTGLAPGPQLAFVLRLALVAELMGWADKGGDEPRSISSLTLGAVVDFIEECGKPMALRVYGDAALPQVERDVAVVGRHIIRHKLRQFNAKRMRREAGYNGPKDATRLHAALTSSQTVTGSTKRARGLATRRAASPPTTPSIRGCMAMGEWLDKAQRQTRSKQLRSAAPR